MENPVTPLKPSPAARAKSFVRRHRVGLSAASSSIVTATICYKLHMVDRSAINAFLEEKGLLDELIETHPLITK